MVNVGDVGKDYEHGVQLLKKLSSFRSSGDRVRVQLLRRGGDCFIWIGVSYNMKSTFGCVHL